MQLDIYNKSTIETETIVYDIVREWQTVYTHKSITVTLVSNGNNNFFNNSAVTVGQFMH